MNFLLQSIPFHIFSISPWSSREKEVLLLSCDLKENNTQYIKWSCWHMYVDIYKTELYWHVKAHFISMQLEKHDAPTSSKTKLHRPTAHSKRYELVRTKSPITPAQIYLETSWVVRKLFASCKNISKKGAPYF
jgi:hypothetical protein